MQKNLLVILSILILAGAGCVGADKTQIQEGSGEAINPEPKQSENIMQEQKTFSYQGELSKSERTDKIARIKTSKGEIVIELYNDTPLTTSNFVYLSNGGFYDNLTFHRYVENFVIQGGDPLGTGTGGPGYTVPAEIKHKHKRGSVATARQNDVVNPTRASSGSQFYIALEDLPNLDNQYTVFGNVIEGMDVVDALRKDDGIISIKVEDK